MRVLLALSVLGVVLSTGLAAAAEWDAACRAAQVVSSHRLVSIPWLQVKPTVPDATSGAASSPVRVKIYETLTQDASWRFHNNVLPKLIANYGARVGFEIYLHPSADFRNVLASQLVSCVPQTQRLAVIDALFKAMASGELPHDDANTPAACGDYYGKLRALGQKVLPMSAEKFAQCMASQEGLVHQDAIDKMSSDDGVRRNPAVFVNGKVEYDYDLAAVSRRIDAAR
jgi:protein-disulfide isomerase